MKKTVINKKIVLTILILLFISQIPIAITEEFEQIERNNQTALFTKIYDKNPCFAKSFFWWPIIKFHSYMDFSHNLSEIKKPIPIDSSAVVTTTIKYWTDIPQLLRRGYPLNYIFLFGSPIGPMQKIHLEILESPEWVDIYISYADILTSIPFDSEEPVEMETNIIITPKVEAPAETTRIDIIGSCDNIKRLNGYSYQESIEFTVEFLPCLNINSPSVSVIPKNQTTAISINVTNCGNYLTKVIGEIVEYPDNFDIIFIPPNQIIKVNEKEQFYLIVEPPLNFTGYELIQLKFNAQRYPIKPNSPEGNYSYCLVIKVV